MTWQPQIVAQIFLPPVPIISERRLCPLPEQPHDGKEKWSHVTIYNFHKMIEEVAAVLILIVCL